MKKFILLFMAALILVFCKPVAGYANPATAITLTDMSESQYVITDSESGTGWSYDKESNTLTLSGWEGLKISSNGDFNLVLSGTNTINLPDEAGSTAITSGGNHVTVSGSSASDKLVIKGDLTEYFYGIYTSMYLEDNAHIELDITSTSTSACYGLYNYYVYFKGSNASLDANITGGGPVTGIYSIQARTGGEYTCGDGNTANIVAKSTGSSQVIGLSDIYVYNANPQITVSAINDGTKPEDCYGVRLLNDIYFSSGGKIDITGRACSNMGKIPDNITKNIVTTIPANNEYYWDIDKDGGRNTVYNLDGTMSYHTVFEYSETPANLVWYGDTRFTLPGGKEGESIYDHGNSFYLTDYIRGLDGYNTNATFEIKSGTLPEGITLNRYYGSLSGRFTKQCPAGSVVITVTNSKSKDSLSFTLNYGAVAETDRFINVGGTKVLTRADASGMGWSYAAATQTLTLNGYGGGKIASEIDLNIALIGANTITLANEAHSAGIESDKCITILGSSASDKLIIQGNLSQDFYGIDSNIVLLDNVHLEINISSTSTSSCYGNATHSVTLEGSNISIDANVTSAGGVTGIYAIDARTKCGDGTVINVDARSTGPCKVSGIDSLYIYKTNPVITVSATNDGTKPDYCYGVYCLSDLYLTTGGKLDVTGRVATNRGRIPENMNSHIVTTTPAGNAYYWDVYENVFGKRNSIFKTDGTLSYNTVFVYSDTPAELVWYGDDFVLPGGTEGETLSDSGYSFYLTDYVRGLDGYSTKATFKITSGSLPNGITLNEYYGNISGSFSKRCDAGTVDITVTNNTSKNSLVFTLKYGAVASANPVTGLTLSDSAIIVGKGVDKSITAAVTPTDASYANVTATSSDTNIATVLSIPDPVDGVTTITIHPYKTGVVTITVTSLDTGIKKTLTVSVMESVPNAQINYIDEEFYGLDANKDYIIDVSGIQRDVTASDLGEIDILEAYMGQTVQIIKKGATVEQNSAPQSIAVPARPAAPTDCTYVKATNKNTPDAILDLKVNNREYKEESDSSWSVAYSTTVNYLACGNYNVRERATSTRFTGLAATVTIDANPLAFGNMSAVAIPNGTKNVPIDNIYLSNYVSGGKPGYTYLVVSGPTWIDINVYGNGVISGTPNAVEAASTLVIKVVDEDSDEITTSIPVGAISACYHTGGTATCTTYKECEICHEFYGSLLDHDYSPATCTEPKTCKNCPATDGVALGHDYAAATCTEPKTCKNCPATEGVAIGHDYAAATCTDPEICNRCTQTRGVALGHNYTEATCTSPKTCTVCTATEGAALGHNYKAATCTEPEKCDRCTATRGIALGHDYADPTCIAPATCRRCSDTIGIPAKENHNQVSVNNAIAATCIAEGKESDTKCEYCGKILSIGATIAKVEHRIVTDPEVAATCTEKGKTAGKHCSVCNEVFVAQTDIPAKGHTAADPVVTPATTKKDGTIITKCSVCSETIETTAIAKAYVVVEQTAKYTGRAVKQPVKVVDSAGKSISKNYYKVTYKNNIKEGKATATVSFTGNYSGKVSKDFTIVNKSVIPTKVSGLKVTAGSKSLKVGWKKGPAISDGYEIQYSTDKNFLTGVKSVKVSKADTVSKDIKKLKSKTNYYVRIRAYNKDGKTTAYSTWTVIKKAVKTK